jgi:epoxyqueuosine reductase
MTALTGELKRRALAEGFDRVSIAPATRLERDEGALRRWLGNGQHADMTWMERVPEKRADPRELLPGCKSVVMLATNYWPGDPPDDPNAGRARVATYARGRDYHKILGKRLKRLAAWLAEASDSDARTFVDTGPVLERAWAERAGMGWIGKNANLLTRDMGSWLLLGEILSAAELTPDAGPHADFCGSCTACIDACPTDAIVDPGVVDSNLCISYWTIEHRGSVPKERRPGNGDWIFGCDICQDVCPWNQRFAVPAEADPFERREDLHGLDPVHILGLDEAAFRARYSGTALMRAKWEGMRRNACIVLGNRGQASALPVLAQALADDDPVLRSHAAWAVATIGGNEALELLRQSLPGEDTTDVLDEINDGIARLVAPAN